MSDLVPICDTLGEWWTDSDWQVHLCGLSRGHEGEHRCCCGAEWGGDHG